MNEEFISPLAVHALRRWSRRIGNVMVVLTLAIGTAFLENTWSGLPHYHGEFWYALTHPLSLHVFYLCWQYSLRDRSMDRMTELLLTPAGSRDLFQYRALPIMLAHGAAALLGFWSIGVYAMVIGRPLDTISWLWVAPVQPLLFWGIILPTFLFLSAEISRANLHWLTFPAAMTAAAALYHMVYETAEDLTEDGMLPLKPLLPALALLPVAALSLYLAQTGYRRYLEQARGL